MVSMLKLNLQNREEGNKCRKGILQMKNSRMRSSVYTWLFAVKIIWEKRWFPFIFYSHFLALSLSSNFYQHKRTSKILFKTQTFFNRFFNNWLNWLFKFRLYSKDVRYMDRFGEWEWYSERGRERKRTRERRWEKETELLTWPLTFKAVKIVKITHFL